MRTDAAVPKTRYVAVETHGLENRRKSVPDGPSNNLCASDLSSHAFSMSRAVTVDVIKRQHLLARFSATNTSPSVVVEALATARDAILGIPLLILFVVLSASLSSFFHLFVALPAQAFNESLAMSLFRYPENIGSFLWRAMIGNLVNIRITFPTETFRNWWITLRPEFIDWSISITSWTLFLFHCVPLAPL
ncbi:MAG TPA: hypothetical protein VMW38_11810 [Terriglobia bacterium]|nr:hypothetical protein [Terriglobia bacterium]